MKARVLCIVASVVAVVTAPVTLGTELAVAVHVSQNTMSSWTYANWKWFHPNQFLEEALRSDGTPFVEIGDAEITAGALFDESGGLRYPILFSLAAEAVSDAEAEQIRLFTAAGGTVYVGASAWTSYQDGRPRLDSRRRPTSALSRELGLNPVGWTLITHVEKKNDDPMVDHLAPDIYEWQMPRVYWYANTWASHFIFGAVPTGDAPATVLMAALQRPYFLTSVSAPPMIDNAATATVRFADVNGDGKADLIYRVGENVYVRLSNGQGFAPPVLWATWRADYDFNFADVDGDGKADLVGRSGNDLRVALSDGTKFRASSTWARWDVALDYRLADVDGDGRADLIGRSGGDLLVALSNGSSFGTAQRWITWGVGSDYQLGDVNGDGKADLVARVGTTVQAALSDGSRFLSPQSWSQWNPAYDFRLADVDGDGRADIIGRSGVYIRVGLSTGTSFKPSSAWTTWSTAYDLNLADVNGDGSADVIGFRRTPITEGDPRTAGDVEIALSGGVGSDRMAELAVKPYRDGMFVYNAEIVPLAGYGGFANDNSEYKTTRRTVENAFARLGLPLVTLAPWPFPSKSAMIFRHDHFLAMDIHRVEEQLAGASSGHRFGEYYIQPDQAGFPGQCGEFNDYPIFSQAAVDGGAILGSHAKYHIDLDRQDYATALAKLVDATKQIQSDTGNLMSPVFVAPAYHAVSNSSLQAIRDAGFLTTGEQGVGPMPHFAVDPENNKGHIGSLLQLPTSEWPGFDNIERMSVDKAVITMAVDLAYSLNGLINVYDHAGGDPYPIGCPSSRLELSNLLLQYVKSLPRVWLTNSLEIRDWWLQRERRSVSASFTRPTSGSAVIGATVNTAAPIATTPFSADQVALRITLDYDSQVLSQAGVAVTLDGTLLPGRTCSDQPNAVLCDDGELLIRVGTARQVTVELGAGAGRRPRRVLRGRAP